MSKKKRKKNKSASSKNQAGKTEFPKASRQEKSRNCPVRPFESENADSIAEEKPSLRIRKTDFEYGFQPVTPYLRARLSNRIREYMNELCVKAGFSLDSYYWETISSEILDTESAEETLIVASRAGYGKSTFIKAFILAVIALCKEKREYAEELSGIVVVLQKVEDLNALVNCAHEYFDNSTAIIALQGWTPSAQREGYCQNPDVRNYQECKPRKCPYASECKVQAFHDKAPSAYVVGLTQERFKRYLDTPQMETILNRQSVSGESRPRRYIFLGLVRKWVGSLPAGSKRLVNRLFCLCFVGKSAIFSYSPTRPIPHRPIS